MSDVRGAKPKSKKDKNNLYIELERSTINQVYFPGQIVRGNVIVINTDFDYHVKGKILNARISCNAGVLQMVF